MSANETTGTATPDERENRIDEVLGLMAKGLSQAQIVRFLQQKTEWGAALSDRQCRNYVYAANDTLRNEMKHVDRAQAAATVIRQIEYIFSQAIKLQDLKTALAALDRKIKMLKLDDPSHELDWKQAFAAAGLDPDATYSEFIAMLTTSKVSHAEEED